MKNFIIAITRTCGSGATTISTMLSRDLNINMYDRNLLRLAADDQGINEAAFANADETMKNSILYKVTRKVYSGQPIPMEHPEDIPSNDQLFSFQAKVLKELAENESYICIGRAADFVLKEYPNMVSIFIYAPEAAGPAGRPDPDCRRSAFPRTGAFSLPCACSCGARCG